MKIIVGWSWQQALAFVIAFAVVCGPWLYMLWAMKETT